MDQGETIEVICIKKKITDYFAEEYVRYHQYELAKQVLVDATETLTDQLRRLNEQASDVSDGVDISFEVPFTVPRTEDLAAARIPCYQKLQREHRELVRQLQKITHHYQDELSE